MWWLLWLMIGATLGFLGAALIVASSQGDLLAEVRRLRALEDDLGRLELAVVDSPGIGVVFRCRLRELVSTWQWAADDGRWIIAEGLSVSPIVVVDEIGEPLK